MFTEEMLMTIGYTVAIPPSTISLHRGVVEHDYPYETLVVYHYRLESILIVRYKLICGDDPLMKTLQEIEKAIVTLPWLDRIRLYKDMPHLIGGDVEDLDWQRLALDRFFQDDSPDDHVYDHV